MTLEAVGCTGRDSETQVLFIAWSLLSRCLLPCLVVLEYWYRELCNQGCNSAKLQDHAWGDKLRLQMMPLRKTVATVDPELKKMGQGNARWQSA